MLTVVLLALGTLVASGAIAAASRSDRAALALGTGGAIGGCLAGGGAAAVALVTGEQVTIEAWPLPLGAVSVGLDPLTAFFLLCIFLVSGLSAVYGAGYLKTYAGQQRLAPAVFFFNLLVAAMGLVCVARDGVLFLVAWEVMTVASFFLVTFEHDRDDVRRAGMTYLIASQLGVVFLFVLFLLLGRSAGDTGFDRIAHTVTPPGLAGICFLLAVVGFGTKAGFWPLHVWLPDAHPAAPSHVSAVMSGVMIKIGIYGLLRTVTLLGDPEPWWGALLVGIGAVSGVTGILQALAQHDLKRLLAYSSVENIGIIALGSGIGLLGTSLGSPAVAFLGYAGALLHVLNHGLFKGLLFHGAGSVLHGTGTRQIELLGGLAKRMPVTALTFLCGSVAIAALPPLNGFASEWLIYGGAFRGGGGLGTVATVSTLVAITALVLIGGLAAACFAKAFGIVFLGEPRTADAAGAHEAGPAMKASMIAGALLCAAIGLYPAGAVELVAPAVSSIAPGAAAAPAGVMASLGAITRIALVMLCAVAFLVFLRRALLGRRPVTSAPTWGCGYAEPSPRMQYSAASFAEPLLAPFAPILPSRVTLEGPDGIFPESARYSLSIGDPAGERLLLPAVRRAVQELSRLRWLQRGRLHLYLMYIAVTLVALLVWQLLGAGP